MKSSAAPSVKAHHSLHGPDTGRNSGGRRIKNLSLHTYLQKKKREKLQISTEIKEKGPVDLKQLRS